MNARMERDIAEIEVLPRHLFDNMLEGFAYCRMVFEDGKPRDFVYLKVNRAFERLTGLTNVAGKRATEALEAFCCSRPKRA